VGNEHDYHLPLNTDFVQAAWLAHALAARHDILSRVVMARTQPTPTSRALCKRRDRADLDDIPSGVNSDPAQAHRSQGTSHARRTTGRRQCPAFRLALSIMPHGKPPNVWCRMKPPM